MTDPTPMSTSQFILWSAVILAVYLMPSIIAALRRHHQAVAIVILNLFLGWTFLGWVGALVWAATRVVKEPRGF